ncbi:hypothetical protein [Planctomyces sp. SH-PL14]|uniref:hypothetical protein n=1 Tax=Planctomyces sp. SH-PL14 TaxID=1632864 RepID=UPI00078EE2ED|nr:hypothetical protein [Planctomyces sp. SH-PL14]AMV22030.1 hypothetical protein VT03_29275 [Planctomyces sp. SH-PL14]
MTDLEGKWQYQSFRPEPIALSVGVAKPPFEAWSSVGDVTIDAGSKSGTLTFSPPPIAITLALTLTVTDGDPESVSISAVGALPNGAPFTNTLHGWLVPLDPSKPIATDNPAVIRGSIVQTSAAATPKFTTGFFVIKRV